MHRSSYIDTEEYFRVGTVLQLSSTTSYTDFPKHKAILISGNSTMASLIVTGTTFDGAQGITGIDSNSVEYSSNQNQLGINVSSNETFLLHLEIAQIDTGGGFPVNTTVTFLN